MVHINSGNLFANLPVQRDEAIDVLISGGGARIERIVSTGQASPPGFWYDQDGAEFVIVLAGSADLRFEHEAEPRRLGPGDWLDIPARCRHRVDWTDASTPTVWLTVHRVMAS